MPISNLAIQRRRLNELEQLTFDKDLELFNVELHTASYHGKHTFYGHENFIIHGRKITPQNLKKLNDEGFSVQSVKRMNDYTLIIEVQKWAPEKKK